MANSRCRRVREFLRVLVNVTIFEATAGIFYAEIRLGGCCIFSPRGYSATQWQVSVQKSTSALQQASSGTGVAQEESDGVTCLGFGSVQGTGHLGVCHTDSTRT